jgi:hypothetical protein
VVNLTAGVDRSGQITVWTREAWTLTKGDRPNATTPGNIISGALAGFPTPPLVLTVAPPPKTFSNNGNAAANYVNGVVGRNPPGGTGTVASQQVLTHTIASPFFTAPLRSPDRLQNTFANESFMDEVAAAISADPVDYRLRHLSDPRLIAVLNAAAKAANWDTRPSPNPGNARTGVVTGRGVACVLYEGNNGYSAMVAEVSVDQATGVITVTRIVTSQDSGPVSNPDGLRNQMEGGALQGMSRALHEEVKWNVDSSAITSIDWKTYPVFPFGAPLPVDRDCAAQSTQRAADGRRRVYDHHYGGRYRQRGLRRHRRQAAADSVHARERTRCSGGSTLGTSLLGVHGGRARAA